MGVMVQLVGIGIGLIIIVYQLWNIENILIEINKNLSGESHWRKNNNE